MSKRMLALTWAAAAAAWGDLAYLLVVVDVGALAHPFHSLRLLYYVLMALAPALTFFPLARMMGLRAFGLEATLAWAGLAGMLALVPPDAVGLPGYMAFLALAFLALASVFLPLGYAVGFRLLTLRAHRRDTGRARREAYLAALFVVLAAVMNMEGFLNPLNALLLGGMLLLVESFALARKPGAVSY